MITRGTDLFAQCRSEGKGGGMSVLAIVSGSSLGGRRGRRVPYPKTTGPLAEPLRGVALESFKR